MWLLYYAAAEGRRAWPLRAGNSNDLEDPPLRRRISPRNSAKHERYGSSQDQRGEEFDVSVAEAINQCHAGDPDGGIATLSRMLKDQDFTLPPRPKS